MPKSEADTRVVDVVVVGAGVAALRAAIAARKTGAEVVVVTRGGLGRGGSSVMTTGGIAVAMRTNGDDPKLHFADTMNGGREIADPDLVQILSEEAESQIHDLLEFGGGVRRKDNSLVFRGNADHSLPRNLESDNNLGTAYTIPMARTVKELGADVLEFSMVVSLLTDAEGDGVHGVAVLNLKSLELSEIRAGATVLATGGCGQLYPITSNPSDVTGDGFSLAARAGAVLRDMEFVQFYPYRCVDPFSKSRVAIQPSTFSAGGRLYNSDNYRFMTDYDAVKQEATTRDIAARAIFDQIRQGKGVHGGARLDLGALTPAEMEETNPKMVRALQRTATDYRTYPFVVAPEAHYFMGGVRIDVNGKSSVEHLYAAGEVAGGVQGANRLTNNSLPDALVFGRRAGVAAARDALNRGRGKKHELRNFRGDRSDARPTALKRRGAGSLTRQEIQAVAWSSLGIVRNASDLDAGAVEFAGLRERLNNDGATAAQNPAEWYSMRSLLDTAELSLAAARIRTESRGAHFREDYPLQDDSQWRRSVAVVLDTNDEVSCEIQAEVRQTAQSL